MRRVALACMLRGHRRRLIFPLNTKTGVASQGALSTARRLLDDITIQFLAGGSSHPRRDSGRLMRAFLTWWRENPRALNFEH